MFPKMLRFVTLFAVTVALILADANPSNIFKIDITPEEAQQYLNNPPFITPELSGRTAVLPLVKYNDPSFRAAEAGPTLGHYWKNGQEIENTNDYLEEVYNAAQFHGQDGLGAYTYGYRAPESAKVENRVHSGDVTGSYVYKAGSSNDLIKVRYWADSQGFHQEDNIPKYQPKQVEDTEAVKQAKLAHEKAWKEAADANLHPYAYQQQQQQQQQVYQQNQGQSGFPNQQSQNYQQGNQKFNSQQAENSQQSYQTFNGQQGFGLNSQGFNSPQGNHGFKNQQSSAFQGQQGPQNNAGFLARQDNQGLHGQQGFQSQSYQDYQSQASAPQNYVTSLQEGQNRESKAYEQNYVGPQQYQSQSQSNPVQDNQQYKSVQEQYQEGAQQYESGQYDPKYQDPEPTGPPRGFFYSYEYPVSIIVPKSEIQGGAVNPGHPVDHDTIAVSGQHS